MWSFFLFSLSFSFWYCFLLFSFCFIYLENYRIDTITCRTCGSSTQLRARELPPPPADSLGDSNSSSFDPEDFVAVVDPVGMCTNFFLCI